MILMNVHTCDTTQSYLLYRKKREGDIFILSPKQTRVLSDQVLEVVKTLHGILESGLHWHVTCTAYYVSKLIIKRLRADKCCMFGGEDHKLVGVIFLQVDDSINVRSKTCVKKENKNQ